MSHDPRLDRYLDSLLTESRTQGAVSFKIVTLSNRTNSVEAWVRNPDGVFAGVNVKFKVLPGKVLIDGFRLSRRSDIGFLYQIDMFHLHTTLDSRQVVCDVLRVCAQAAPGPELLRALGAALVQPYTRTQTVAQRLFIPDQLRGPEDRADGRMVCGPVTEPYPGAWPHKAVASARAGDLTALWPYMTS